MGKRHYLGLGTTDSIRKNTWGGEKREGSVEKRGRKKFTLEKKANEEPA